MLTGYNIINLTDFIRIYGEEATCERLQKYSCPLNPDVEVFLRRKAIEFSKQGISRTHLIYVSYREQPVLVGYYALAQKTISIHKSNLSRSSCDRLRRFSTYDPEIGKYTLSAFLIGQLGKNFENNYNRLISGDELLNIALGQLSKIQYEVGGKYVYLECEDEEKLTAFYSRNGFVEFGRRPLDRDEIGYGESKCLVQMLFDMRNFPMNHTNKKA